MTDENTTEEIFNAVISGNLGALKDHSGHIENINLVRFKNYGKEGVLNVAAREGNLDIVQYLLARGANLESQHTESGSTPLIYAAANNHTQVMRYLIESGANIDATNDHGQTALFYAVESEAFEAAELLVKHNADTTIADDDGATVMDLIDDDDFREAFVAAIEKHALSKRDTKKTHKTNDETAAGL